MRYDYCARDSRNCQKAQEKKGRRNDEWRMTNEEGMRKE
jgi:hypothetical protein